jgi:hypothetical protein
MAVSSLSLLRGEYGILVESSRRSGRPAMASFLFAMAGLALLAPASASTVLRPNVLARLNQGEIMQTRRAVGARRNIQKNLGLRGGADTSGQSGAKNFGLFRSPVRQEKFHQMPW